MLELCLTKNFEIPFSYSIFKRPSNFLRICCMKNIALIPYQFIEKLKKISGIKRIILYGSRARGDNEERSDIDLAIDCPGISFDEWNAIINIIEQADTLLTIDFVRFDTLSEKNPLRISIERDGLILYQKDSHE